MKPNFNVGGFGSASLIRKMLEWNVHLGVFNPFGTTDEMRGRKQVEFAQFNSTSSRRL